MKYFWSNMRIDVIAWCKACKTCAARKNPARYTKAPLKPLPIEGPFVRVSMDILGPLPKTYSGDKYIPVFADAFTKWPEAFVLPDQRAETMA